jgi:hypothetical protein
MTRVLPPLALLLPLLAACATPQEATPGSSPVGFACPAAGTVVTTSMGVRRYMGSVPNDPENCLMQQPGFQAPTELLYAVFAGAAAEAADMRPVLRGFFPLSPGKRVEHTLRTQRGQWRIFLHAVGQERLTVPAGSFDTWLVEIREQGFGAGQSDIIRRTWFDAASWVAVKQTYQVIRPVNATLPRDWEALSIARPGS